MPFITRVICTYCKSFYLRARTVSRMKPARTVSRTKVLYCIHPKTARKVSHSKSARTVSRALVYHSPESRPKGKSKAVRRA